MKALLGVAQMFFIILILSAAVYGQDIDSTKYSYELQYEFSGTYHNGTDSIYDIYCQITPLESININNVVLVIGTQQGKTDIFSNEFNYTNRTSDPENTSWEVTNGVIRIGTGLQVTKSRFYGQVILL